MKTKSLEIIKKRVLDKIENLSEEELIELDRIIDNLDSRKSRIEQILSFREFLDKVEDPDLIRELTVDLPKNRLKSNRNIETFESDFFKD
ncbi:hypothetical protein SAMN00777080_1633 [Aquiflexum balticum DSM 16537]|uniref:Uncharacterized protein n=1 Tax=Aquiflexum balticum DSM 16537 TaxID=758820 RepID=A0A1W2H267_9BACT|nr:hypothetical protein [Aquiflexum balticum]SMD43057.1 hypothetical protein SAMN00777080_1633 [Aquiflexum balticum DSM 16537]